MVIEEALANIGEPVYWLSYQQPGYRGANVYQRGFITEVDPKTRTALVRVSRYGTQFNVRTNADNLSLDTRVSWWPKNERGDYCERKEVQPCLTKASAT